MTARTPEEAHAWLNATLDKYEELMDKVELQYRQVLAKRGPLTGEDLEFWRPTLRAPGGVQSLFWFSEQADTPDEQRARIDAVLARHQAGLRVAGTF